jgi:hypothetical protein
MANFPKHAVTSNEFVCRVRASGANALFLVLVPLLPSATFAGDPPRFDEQRCATPYERTDPRVT